MRANVQAFPMTIPEGIYSSVAGVFVGWFLSSFFKVGKSELRDVVKAQQEAMKEMASEILTMKKELAERVTRVEFDRSVTKLEILIKDFRTEMRADMKELKN